MTGDNTDHDCRAFNAGFKIAIMQPPNQTRDPWDYLQHDRDGAKHRECNGQRV
jgi:hypothetical protein